MDYHYDGVDRELVTSLRSTSTRSDFATYTFREGGCAKPSGRASNGRRSRDLSMSDPRAAFRVFFDGPAAAGGRTTLRTLREYPDPEFTPLPADPSTLSTTIAAMEVLVRGKVPTSFFCDVIDDRSKDPRIAAEATFLSQVDLITFVLDPQVQRMAANQGRVDKLRSALTRLGRDPDSIPVIFQVNKSDLSTGLGVDAVRDAVRWPNARYVSTSAISKDGLRELVDELVYWIAELSHP